MAHKQIILKISTNEDKENISTLKIQGEVISSNRRENKSSLLEILLNKDSIGQYQNWKISLNRLLEFRFKRTFSTRLKVPEGPNKDKNPYLHEIDKLAEECINNHEKLIKSINNTLDKDELISWLRAELDEKEDLESQLNQNEDFLKIIYDVEDLDVGILPWEYWNFWNDYYKTKNLFVGFSTNFSYTYKNKSTNTNEEHTVKFPLKVPKVLVIFGSNSGGINLEVDKTNFDKLQEEIKTSLNEDLENLQSRSNIKIKEETPTSQKELEEILLREEWNIIYYCGHTKSSNDNKDVELLLDKEVTVQFQQLLGTFEKIINDGHLKLIIVNSCQSLGIAFELIPLGLPNIIVMRESITDHHAHYFVRYLLESFIIGLPLTSAFAHSQPHLRNAYDKIHDIPGASMLPVLFLTIEAVKELDTPVINFPGRHQSSYDMLALENLARHRLALSDYALSNYTESSENKSEFENSELEIQEYYANLLHHKNKVAVSPEEVTNIHLNDIWCGDDVKSGTLIWEISFYVIFGEQKIIWGKGFVNIKNGNSELLLDHRPSEWYGRPVFIDENDTNSQDKKTKIKAFKIDENDYLDVKGNKVKPSLTKIALLELEKKYEEYNQTELKSKYHKYSETQKNSGLEIRSFEDWVQNIYKNDFALEISSFSGWLKDINKKVYLKNFIIFSWNEKEYLDSEDIRKKAYNETPFGKARNELGITECKIQHRRIGRFLALRKRDEWTEKDIIELRVKGCDDSYLDTVLVPDVIIAINVRRPK